MMDRNNLTNRMGLTVALVACFLSFFVLSGAVEAEEAAVEAEEAKVDYVAKAKHDAEKARADAEKAMAEAEMAIAEANRAIAEAESARSAAKKDKAHAIEKMVEAHRYPEDISMTVPESTTTAVFSHKKHTEREHLKCIECHPKVFIMKVGKNVVKKGQLTMSEMQKGKYCGNCHNGHKAFSVSDINTCKRCHPNSRSLKQYDEVCD